MFVFFMYYVHIRLLLEFITPHVGRDSERVRTVLLLLREFHSAVSVRAVALISLVSSATYLQQVIPQQIARLLAVAVAGGRPTLLVV